MNFLSIDIQAPIFPPTCLPRLPGAYQYQAITPVLPPDILKKYVFIPNYKL